MRSVDRHIDDVAAVEGVRQRSHAHEIGSITSRSWRLRSSTWFWRNGRRAGAQEHGRARLRPWRCMRSPHFVTKPPSSKHAYSPAAHGGVQAPEGLHIYYSRGRGCEQAESTTVLPNAAVEWAVNKALLDAPVGHDQRARAAAPGLRSPLPRLVLQKWATRGRRTTWRTSARSEAWPLLGRHSVRCRRWRASSGAASTQPRRSSSRECRRSTHELQPQEDPHFKQSAKEVAKKQAVAGYVCAVVAARDFARMKRRSLATCLQCHRATCARARAAPRSKSSRCEAIEGPPDVPMPSGFRRLRAVG